MEDDWDVGRNSRGWPFGTAGIGILRITLLFGSVAVALALILAPILDSQTRPSARNDKAFGLDDMQTGGIGRGGRVYTIRRSVLQSSPDAVCIIGSNGQRSGDC